MNAETLSSLFRLFQKAAAQADWKSALEALTEAAGASFVARGTAGNIREIEKILRKGLDHSGFSFIEAVVPCRCSSRSMMRPGWNGPRSFTRTTTSRPLAGLRTRA